LRAYRQSHLGSSCLELVYNVAALVAAVEVVLDGFFFMKVQGVQGERLQHIFRVRVSRAVTWVVI
jgi:hypothetical protein